MVARWFALLWILPVTALAAEPATVNQSARDVPIAYQVDVAVVGGGPGAVSAAVSAAQAGAKVFLAAPYSYLGDEMTATLQLWLEPGEEPTAPLAKQLFTDALGIDGLPDPNRIALTYTADRPSQRTHADTNPPSLLADGLWGNATSQSVQYADDTTITADLGRRQALGRVRAMVYQRTSGLGGNFIVKSVTVSTSDDGQAWRQASVIDNRRDAEGSLSEAVILAAPVKGEARYVRFAFKKASDATRILLGEIEVSGPASATALMRGPVRPLHVKKTLDDALLKAGVPFLYSCYATDVLRDRDGRLCGIVMANRAGRQAVLARTIIDATDRATVARLAGAEFRPYPAGMHTFRRVVIGGKPCTAQGMTSRLIGQPWGSVKPTSKAGSPGPYPVIEYTLQLPMADASYASFCKADQQARTLTYHPDQQFTSDRLFEVPPDAMHGQAAAAAGQDLVGLPLEAFQPQGVAGLWVLGGCADVTRDQAAKLLRPVALVDLGARLGTAAATNSKSCPAPVSPHVAGKPADRPAIECEICEPLDGVRPNQKLPRLADQARALPVLGTYDVLVIGGGTGGAPAGIAAARQGAKTLVVEYQHGLGGVGTLGAISNYCVGNRVGFTATVLAETKYPHAWIIEQKMEWWRSHLLQAGAELWFGTIGCGAVVQHGRVVGAVVATPAGRGVVLAKAVVDATGNADVAAAAGAACIYTDENELAMQGTGLPPRQLGASYANTDFTFTDETDLLDVWRIFVTAKEKFPRSFDVGKFVDTRERRCIVGDFTISVLDEVNARTYPDTVVQALGGHYDTHGYTVDPYLVIAHPNTGRLIVNVPYRTMLPKNLEGILVCSLGLSAHRDAIPLIRMQPDIQNGGYAAGVAAAMAARSGTLVRNIDVRALQEHLVSIGNLKPSVLTDRDSYPIPTEKLATAVKEFAGRPSAASAVFAQPGESLPLVRAAYEQAKAEERLKYAWLLAMLGDATGVDTLLAEVAKAKWDAGWNYKGMGQFGNALSPVDGQIVALGRAGDRRAVPVVLAKLNQLTADSEFSHFRAVGLALESLRDPSAAKPLADMLRRPGIAGYVHKSIADAQRLEVPGGPNGEISRRTSLRELLLARALYRCGDYEGLGHKTLRNYAQDLRGHIARHAQAVLGTGK
jgi:ribulose 1,5-bisphosphate synthetase/thiazole synthase